jgi:hypothetical protein
MKEIELSQGKVAIVDDEDYDKLIAMGKWYAKRDGQRWYATRNTENSKIVTRKTVRMHRIILDVTNGMEVDHINGNGLDNRKTNIRICTRRQNMWNRNVYRNSYLGIRGVRSNKKGFIARITINGILKYLGTFNTPEEAHSMYIAESKKLRGEFHHS